MLSLSASTINFFSGLCTDQKHLVQLVVFDYLSKLFSECWPTPISIQIWTSEFG